jgi:hypothetical protein
MQLSFRAKIIEWRGPAPFFYAPVPNDQAEDIHRAAKAVSYGWGVIPVEAVIGGVTFRTSLFPRDETYLLPIKAEVRRKIGITAGDTIEVEMELGPRK